MQYTPRLVDAFALTFDLHKEQVRKGGAGIPYLTHLMAVASIVGEHGGSEDQVIAALLHDAIEDQGGPPVRALIAERFGEAVAWLADGCSDTDVSPKPPWHGRKEQFIERMRTAAPELRLIVAADKLHNARTTVHDLRVVGGGVWKRFSVGRDKTLWYYVEMLHALSEGWSHPILRDLADAIDQMHRLSGSGTSSVQT